jgi:hypothetical protein
VLDGVLEERLKASLHAGMVAYVYPGHVHFHYF